MQFIGALVRFVFSKEEEDEEDEESVKNMFTCISYLVRYFHTIFACSYFLMGSPPLCH